MELALLFLTDYADPISFCTKDLPDQGQVEHIIQSNGGLVTDTPGPHTVYLVSNPKVGGTTTGLVPPYNTFSVSFIRDCVWEKRLQQLKNYWVHKVADFDEKFNPVDVMLGRLTWDDCKKVQSRSAPAMNPDDELFYNDDLLARHPAKTRSKYRQSYRHSERLEILKYIVRKSAYSRVNGNALWKEMEKAEVCVGRSWQSMREHFRRYILHHLDQFPDNLVEAFRQPGGLHGFCRPLQMFDLVKEEDNEVQLGEEGNEVEVAAGRGGGASLCTEGQIRDSRNGGGGNWGHKDEHEVEEERRTGSPSLRASPSLLDLQEAQERESSNSARTKHSKGLSDKPDHQEPDSSMDLLDRPEEVMESGDSGNSKVAPPPSPSTSGHDLFSTTRGRILPHPPHPRNIMEGSHTSPQCHTQGEPLLQTAVEEDDDEARAGDKKGGEKKGNELPGKEVSSSRKQVEGRTVLNPARKTDSTLQDALITKVRLLIPGFLQKRAEKRVGEVVEEQEEEKEEEDEERVEEKNGEGEKEEEEEEEGQKMKEKRQVEDEEKEEMEEKQEEEEEGEKEKEIMEERQMEEEEEEKMEELEEVEEEEEEEKKEKEKEEKKEKEKEKEEKKEKEKVEEEKQEEEVEEEQEVEDLEEVEEEEVEDLEEVEEEKQEVEDLEEVEEEEVEDLEEVEEEEVEEEKQEEEENQEENQEKQEEWEEDEKEEEQRGQTTRQQSCHTSGSSQLKATPRRKQLAHRTSCTASNRWNVPRCPLRQLTETSRGSPRKFRGSGAYTVQEDLSIISFIEEHNAYDRVGGRAMWEEMSAEFDSERTWQSLKERFRKRIITSLQSYIAYGLNSKSIARLENRVSMKTGPSRHKKNKKRHKMGQHHPQPLDQAIGRERKGGTSSRCREERKKGSRSGSYRGVKEAGGGSSCIKKRLWESMSEESDSEEGGGRGSPSRQQIQCQRDRHSRVAEQGAASSRARKVNSSTASRAKLKKRETSDGYEEWKEILLLGALQSKDASKDTSTSAESQEPHASHPSGSRGAVKRKRLLGPQENLLLAPNTPFSSMSGDLCRNWKMEQSRRYRRGGVKGNTEAGEQCKPQMGDLGNLGARRDFRREKRLETRSGTSAGLEDCVDDSDGDSLPYLSSGLSPELCRMESHSEDEGGNWSSSDGSQCLFDI